MSDENDNFSLTGEHFNIIRPKQRADNHSFTKYKENYRPYNTKSSSEVENILKKIILRMILKLYQQLLWI